MLADGSLGPVFPNSGGTWASHVTSHRCRKGPQGDYNHGHIIRYITIYIYPEGLILHNKRRQVKSGDKRGIHFSRQLLAMDVVPRPAQVGEQHRLPVVTEWLCNSEATYIRGRSPKVDEHEFQFHATPHTKSTRSAKRPQTSC